MLARRGAGGERVGAEERAARAPWRHGWRGVAEHERDQRGLERLQYIGSGHAEMGAAADRDRADPVFARDRDRLLHGARADDEAEPVLSVERRGDRRDPLRFERGARIDQAAAQAVDIARQAAQPMGVDAAQVRAHEALGDGRRVGGRDAMGDEQRPRESLRRGGFGVGVVGFGGSAAFDAFAAASRLPFRRQTLGWCRHQSLISRTAFARAVEAPMRKPRSVPVET
jgi:hypothetical protein